jgi:hypothetical protein
MLTDGQILLLCFRLTGDGQTRRDMSIATTSEGYCCSGSFLRDKVLPANLQRLQKSASSPPSTGLRVIPP